MLRRFAARSSPSTRVNATQSRNVSDRSADGSFGNSKLALLLLLLSIASKCKLVSCDRAVKLGNETLRNVKLCNANASRAGTVAVGDESGPTVSAVNELARESSAGRALMSGNSRNSSTRNKLSDVNELGKAFSAAKSTRTSSRKELVAAGSIALSTDVNCGKSCNRSTDN